VWKPDQSRPRGRPRQQCGYQVREDLKILGMDKKQHWIEMYMVKHSGSSRNGSKTLNEL